MGLLVIGAGFGRTGTTSLKVALERLGFGPCYHMTELFDHPEHLGAWESAVRGEPLDWEEIFGGYRATVDWPGAAFYRELMEAYPDAKVILTVREPDRWYESTMNTIYAMSKTTSSSPVFSLLQRLVPGLRNVKRATGTVEELAWQGVFGGRFEEREHALEVFDRMNREVKESVPPERLLVYDVKEGWGPLCDFLGVEAPGEEPFPHLNDTKSFRRMVRLVRAFTYAVPLFGVSLAVVLGLLLFRRLRGPTSPSEADK